MSKDLPKPFILLLLAANKNGVRYDRAEFHQTGRKKELLMQREGNGYLLTMCLEMKRKNQLWSRLFLQHPCGKYEILKSMVSDFETVGGMSLGAFKLVCDEVLSQPTGAAA